MAKPTYVVQIFVKRRGQLVPGARDVAPTGNGALKRAEALAGRNAGAAAFSIVADPETGEIETATILGQFGEIPDDFAERLREG